MPDIALRPATLTDAAGIAACVCEAYVHYIEHIGRQPGPMLEDYAKVISESSVHVAVDAGRVVGAVVLMETTEGFYVDNVAVRPTARGLGVGRALLELAERQPGPSLELARNANVGQYRTQALR